MSMWPTVVYVDHIFKIKRIGHEGKSQGRT